MEPLEDQNYKVLRGGIHKSHLTLEKLKEQFTQWVCVFLLLILHSLIYCQDMTQLFSTLAAY